MLERGRELVERHQINMIIGGAFFVGIALGLGLGQLAGQSQPAPIIIDKNIKTIPAGEIIKLLNDKGPAGKNSPGNFVASSKRKYYYPADCPATVNLKKENEIWFGSVKEAEARGYTSSKSCVQ